MAKINFSKVSSRLKSAAVMAAGSVASNYVSGMLNRSGRVNPRMNAAIRLGVGALLPGLLGSSKKDGIITDFSNGMLADAAVSLAKAFNVPGVSGTEIDDAINGYTTALNGMHGTDAGDAINGTAN